MGYKKAGWAAATDSAAAGGGGDKGGDPSPPTASPPSPPLPTSVPHRLPAPQVLHAYLPPRAAAVDVPRTILLPCQVAAAPRIPLTMFAPRLDSRPIGEVRPQRHIWPQPRRMHGQHHHDVAPTNDSRGAPLCSRRACFSPFLLLFSLCGRRTLRSFFSKPRVVPSCFFSYVVSSKILLFFYGAVLFTQVYDWSDFFLSVCGIPRTRFL